MRIIKFYNENTMRVRLDTVEDLWTIQRILFKDDVVRAKSERRFKADEGDKSERKDVIVTIKVEKTEFDRDALRLRISGMIVDGSPLKYVQLKSHHTLNIAQRGEIDITKERWSDYLVKVVKDAVSDTMRPRLGIIAVDDEKALPAVLLGYGVKFRKEIYSNTSKRLSQKDFKAEQERFYSSVSKEASAIEAGIIIIAGPGFTKDSIKEYMDAHPEAKPQKELVFESASNTERSGIYEIIKGREAERLIKRERIRKEFILMEEFLEGLQLEASGHGTERVKRAIEGYEASKVIVNDSVLGEKRVQEVLDAAERKGIHIEVFNSLDEAGQQLHSFNDIAYISG